MKRRPGLVGLGLRMGIVLGLLGVQGLHGGEDGDALALADLHDGLLPRARAPAGVGATLGLGLDRQRPHVHYVDVEQRLHRLADLRLVRVGMDAEGVHVRRRQHVALLGYHRADDDLRVLHHELPPRSAWPDSRECPVAVEALRRALPPAGDGAGLCLVALRGRVSGGPAPAVGDAPARVARAARADSETTTEAAPSRSAMPTLSPA